jgi:hypothetical protein
MRKNGSFCLVAWLVVAWVVGCGLRVAGCGLLSKKRRQPPYLPNSSACRVPKITQLIGTCSIEGLNTVVRNSPDFIQDAGSWQRQSRKYVDRKVAHWSRHAGH